MRSVIMRPQNNSKNNSAQPGPGFISRLSTRVIGLFVPIVPRDEIDRDIDDSKQIRAMAEDTIRRWGKIKEESDRKLSQSECRLG
ncbi:MAG TPA: hypothetical protein VD770_04600 [Coxiellaceae bacterium]|nr:hypothetical protein [Coxiellaceae bacterium]